MRRGREWKGGGWEGRGMGGGREKKEVGEQVGKEEERKRRMQKGNGACTDGRREQQGMVENHSTNRQSNATQKDRELRPESLHHVIQHLQHHKSQLLKQWG